MRVSASKMIATNKHKKSSFSDHYYTSEMPHAATGCPRVTDSRTRMQEALLGSPRSALISIPTACAAYTRRSLDDNRKRGRLFQQLTILIIITAL